jgi:hypothetical protein
MITPSGGEEITDDECVVVVVDGIHPSISGVSDWLWLGLP